jgi:hypothetical protein
MDSFVFARANRCSVVGTAVVGGAGYWLYTRRRALISAAGTATSSAASKGFRSLVERT